MEKGMKNLKHKEGFTLLEVLVAISILSFGLLAVASMQVAAIQGNSVAHTVTEGTTAAMDRIEQLAALPYNDADLDAGTHTETQDNYTIEWVVVDPGTVANTKVITVTVSRQDRGGVTRETELTWIKPQF
jgi:type IV pilus assembly protein PilV